MVSEMWSVAGHVEIHCGKREGAKTCFCDRNSTRGANLITPPSDDDGKRIRAVTELNKC